MYIKAGLIPADFFRRYMNMFKKSLAIILCIIMTLALSLSLTGCSEQDANYPVTVGQTLIKEKPKKVCVLSDNLADIIYYMGYSTQICALSDACTQEELTKYISSVGDEVIPDTDKIAQSGATLVLTDTPLSPVAKESLDKKGIEVINLMLPTTEAQLTTLYTTLGKIFGGKTDGAETGKNSCARLCETLSQAEKEVQGSTIVKLVCYLYLDENNALCSYNSTTSEGLLLDFVGAANVAANFPEEKVDKSILRLSNPDYIFCDNQKVIDYLNSRNEFATMTALTNNQTYILPRTALQRFGTSMINTQTFMLSKMFPNSVSSATQGESLAPAYGIAINADTQYMAGDDNEDVKAIQQRLIDLGYLVTEDGNPTTYFGSMTEEAVKSFQSSQGLEATGILDKKTLEVLFLSSTLSVTGTPFIPEATLPTQVPATTPTNPAEPTNAPVDGSNTSGYNIDLTSHKSYQHGDEHEDVKAIQQRLEELLYITFDENITYTTYFGDATENAVTLFQESNGLSATGIADYETLKLLFSDNAQQPQ